MEKNGEYEGEVTALGTNGEGIIKCEGTTTFVPFCLVGESVRFKALKVKGNISYGKLVKLIKSSPDRVEAPCSVFGKCGGCSLQHMNYQSQLTFKKESVEAALSKIGGLDIKAENTVACGKEYRYRNKLAIPLGVNAEGKTVAGFYAPNSHRIVPVSDCLIQSEWVKDIISCVMEFAELSGFSGWDEQKRKGVLKHLVVREIKGAFIIVLVAAKKINAQKLVEIFKLRFKKFTLLLNVNSGEGNAIFGKEWHICCGEGFFQAEEHGIFFKAGANTFLQVNNEIRAKLYECVLAEAGECDAAIDLYSGGGMLTAMLTKSCERAYGIEIVEEASFCADELKELNGLENKMENICGAVEEQIEAVLQKTEGQKRVIVCDPPRKGMERSVVNAIKNSRAEKIILVSCNPATLARDLGLLLGTLEERDGALIKCSSPVNSEYEINRVIPFDMFPQTKWCETLVVLSHKKPDGHINVKVEFGEEEGQFSLKN